MNLLRLVAMLAMVLGATLCAHTARCGPPADGAIRPAGGRDATRARVVDGERGADVRAGASRTDAPKEEKVRVPKAKPRQKGSTDDQKKDEDEDDDEGGFAGCMGDCFFDAMSGMFHRAAEERGAPPPVEPAPTLPLDSAWDAGAAAMIMPADSTSDDAALWSAPGGHAESDSVIGRLRLGSDVIVDSMRTLANGDWVHVHAGEGRSASGWLRSADLVARRPEAAPSAPFGPPAAPAATVVPRSFALVLEPSWFGVGPSDVNLEYADGGWRLGARGNARIGAGWHLGLGAGYAEAWGTPRYDYLTSSRIDEPQHSRLQIVDIALFAGQEFAFPRVTVHWSVGPTLDWVRESADIVYHVVENDAIVATGFETQSLKRWRPGAEVGLGAGGRVGPLRLDVFARGFVIDWRSNGRKSLTLDFIGPRALNGVNIGVRAGL